MGTQWDAIVCVYELSHVPATWLPASMPIVLQMVAYQVPQCAGLEEPAGRGGVRSSTFS